MKLYRAKVPVIADECLDALIEAGDIEVPHALHEEAKKDFEAIMEEFLRRDSSLREQIKDHMSTHAITYDRYGKIRSQMAEERDHPTGDDVERYLVRQFVENLMISPSVDEVYGEDRDIYKKLMEIVKSHDVDEEEIREEARGKIKNVAEGTVEYEIAMRGAVRDVKKRRGLI